MFKLQQLNPQEGEVVKIKFKSINQIMDENLDSKPFHEIYEHFEINDNVKAYVAGGHFLVAAAVNNDEDHKDDPYICVKNHLDHSYDFNVHESVIESIEAVDASEVFVSHDIKVIAVRIEHEMYINGAPLIWNEKENAKSDEKYVNHNRKLIRMFESFITDLAVRDTFQQE